MPSSYTLGKHFENFVQNQLAGGRYNNASEVLRDALRLLEERERRLNALDKAVKRGEADIQAGRVRPAEEVFDRLEAKYTRMAEEHASAPCAVWHSPLCVQGLPSIIQYRR
jgi:antitoxin ParD1/3/4